MKLCNSYDEALHILADNLWIKEETAANWNADVKYKGFFGVYVFRPSTLEPLSSALGPHLVGPRPPKYCKNKIMNKAYYLFKIVLIQN